MRRLCLIIATGLSSTLVLAACGSASKSNTASPRIGASIGIKYAACMRAHGLANFPDPSSGGGIQLNSSSGISPSSPAFQSAQKACQSDLPQGVVSKGANSEARHLQLLHLAQCMRRHGFTTFPDPTSGRPSGPPAGGGLAFGGPGGFISVPASVLQSPGFKQAASACGFPEPGGAAHKSSAAG